MKCISTRIILTFLSILLFSVFGNAQAKYIFKNASLESGTALSVGAVYKFPNVTSGVDAKVKITAITGGISVTNIDGGGGFDQALQPVLSVPSYANGYLELTISFVLAGTSTPSIQTELPITPIDVDGQMYSGLPLYEFDELEVINGYTYFQYAGSELTMTLNGTWARGKNNAAVDYPGIDTAQKQVMFTTVNANISSMRIRVGADNRSGSSASRLRSLYFQKFNYPYSYVLAKEPLIDFSAFQKNEQVELKGTIYGPGNFDEMIIERSIDGIRFVPIDQLSVQADQNDKFLFTYWDNTELKGRKYYRMRLVNSTHKNEKLSHVIVINNMGNEMNGLRVINTMVNAGNPAISIQSDINEETDFYIADMNGRIVNKGIASLSKGVNVVSLLNRNMGKGYFVLVIKTKRGTQSQKIFLQ